MASSYSPQSSPGPAPPRGPVAGGRVGLSEYTAQRLAELRARRAAEADAEGSSSILSTKTTSPSPRITSSGIAPPSQPPPPPPSYAATSESASRSVSSAESVLKQSSDRRIVSPPSPSSSSSSSATDSTGADGASRTPNSSRRPGVTPQPSRVEPRSATEVNSSPVARQHHADSYQSTLPASVTSSSLTASSSPATNGTTTGHSVAGRSPAVSSSVTGSASSASASNHHQQQLMSSSFYSGGGSSSSSSPLNSKRPMPANKAANGEDDEDCLGFASLPEQVHRKAVKRGFDFTVMVVGESGLGKSTLLSCLFLNNDLYAGRTVPPTEERISKTVEIEKKYMEIEERGVKLRLTIVDTPGFNDSVDSTNSWMSIRDYIDSQYDQYFKDESGLNRKNIKDHRVHCCLYFISPYGHGLRQIDIELMRCIMDRVNIVPVIAKADTLTPQEIRRMKARILEEIERHKIRIYEFPDCDSDEDDEFKQQDKELKAAVPFAVMASSTVVEVNGRKIRGRLYPWGIVEVDNPNHSDFSKLRQFIISTHMQDLKDVTRDVHYENFRARHIQEQLVVAQKERNKLKRESGINFDGQSDTERLLLQKESEIQQMKEMLKMMHAQLAVTKQNGGLPVNGVSS